MAIFVFFLKQKTAYELEVRLVRTEMCIWDSLYYMDVWYHVQSKGAIIRKYAVMENPSRRTV